MNRNLAITAASLVAAMLFSFSLYGAERAAAPEQQELAAAMQRVKMLIQRAKEANLDMSETRAMWKRVNELTSEGKIPEAIRLLDETAKELNAALVTQPPKNL